MFETGTLPLISFAPRQKAPALKSLLSYRYKDFATPFQENCDLLLIIFLTFGYLREYKCLTKSQLLSSLSN